METCQILGESIPRSGHHFFIRILRAIFRWDLFYCSPQMTKCCGTFPCRRVGRVPVTFRKSHDFWLTDDPGHDCIYVIQYRDPVFSALSVAEMRRKNNERFADSRHELEDYLAERAAYFVQFMEKWYRPDKKNFVLIDYDRLINDTLGVFEELLTELDCHSKKPGLAAAIEEIRPMGSRTTAYTPRTLEGSQFYDKELFELYETLVLERVKHLTDKRKLAKIDNYEDSAFFHGFVGHEKTFGGDLLGASQAFQRAYDINGSKWFERRAMRR